MSAPLAAEARGEAMPEHVGGDVAADQGRDLGVADVPEGPSFEREPGPVPTPGHAPAVIAPGARTNRNGDGTPTSCVSAGRVVAR